MKNLFKCTTFLLAFSLCIANNLCSMNDLIEGLIGQLDANDLQHLGNDFNNIRNEIGQEAARHRMRIGDFNQRIMEERNRPNPNVGLIAELEHQRARLEQDENLFQGAANVYLNAVGGMTNAFIGHIQSDQRRREILTQGLVNNRGSMDRLREILGQLKDPKNIAKAIALAGGAALAIAVAYYAIKLAYEQAQVRLGKPDLVRKSSRQSMLKSFKNFIISIFGEEVRSGYKLNDVILAPDLEAQVRLLAEDTVQTAEFGLPYQNIILEGQPGTGKSMLAEIIAKRSGMDFDILSGADFEQFKNGENITKLHELFTYARASKKGTILFIDEADACLRDRKTLDKDGINFVNAFLAETGEGSDKFMLILATNYADELDAAVRSRIHKKIHMGLPAADERARIIKDKIEKYITTDERTYINKDGDEITASLRLDETITDEYIEAIAKTLEGFSGRDIEQMVSEMRLRGYRSGENVVTQAIFETVVADKKKTIEQDQKITAFQQERLNKKEGISSPLATT